MTDALSEFHQEFFQDILREAHAGGRFVEDAFFELFGEQLIDAGELESADRARYVGMRGVRIDGYGGDPAYNEGVLSLIILDFQQDDAVSTLTRTDMEAIFKRASSFISKARDRAFRSSLEETSPGFALADLIARSWSTLRKIRLLLLSNRVLSSRVDGQAAGEVEGVPVGYSVWDLGRLFRFVSSGRAREDLIVNLTEHGGPLALLPAHLNDAGYRAYLLVMPGAQLASIYDRWGARLLEQNVRVFLQAKGNVNKGIRNTLEQCPEMFFAYNNGITATAEEIQTESEGRSRVVTALKNLQIVNGGQTTASIYAASRNPRADLAKVFVQVKLSVIEPRIAEEVVPKISEFANSQNKVNAADFFSNHPFHVRMQQISERLFAPSRDGTFRESKWFYERARGQYQDRRTRLSLSETRKFDLEYPKSQLVTKTDLAKALMAWRELPHIVSRGSQKNFGEFAGLIGQEWDAGSDAFNDQYFKHAIAKTIAFRATETIVSGAAWYEGGHRPNFVAYAIAKLAFDVRHLGGAINFDRVWQEQCLPTGLHDSLAAAAAAVKDVITSPQRGHANIGEWAKLPLCWTRVQELRVPYPSSLESALLTRDEEKVNKRSGIKDQKVMNGIEAQIAVSMAGPDFWKRLQRWAADNKVLSIREMDGVKAAANMPEWIPTEKQSQFAMTALDKARLEGFADPLPSSG